MDAHAMLGVASGIVQLASIVPYVRAILYGTTRPNVISWVLWTLLQLVALAVLIRTGATWPVVLLVAMTAGTVLVVILGISGYGYRRYGALDAVCFALTLCAVALWFLTSEPVIALLLIIAADFAAAIPTIVKTYREPWSETPTGWFLVMIAGILSVASATTFEAATLLWSVYIVVVTGGVGTMALLGQRYGSVKSPS